MAIKKGDFIEVEYTGSVKEDGFVFDTTDEKIAKDNGIFDERMDYGSVVVCLGQGQLLPGLEEEIEGKELGEYNIDLSPEKAFGKKDAKMIKMIPFSAFKKQNIMPQQGMQVNIDGMMGTIKTAAGGRCLVDFNHPLSGKELTYKVKVNKIVEDDAEKVKSYMRLGLNLKSEVSIVEGEAQVKIKKEIPKEVQETMAKKLKEMIPSVKKYKFIVQKSVAQK